MNFFKKLFQNPEKANFEKIKSKPVVLSLDDSFVHHFIELGGKFLYCSKKEDVTQNISNILEENQWNSITIKDKKLSAFITPTIDVKSIDNFNNETPLFTTCESLISEDGSILFSSTQVEDNRLPTLTNDFIVFATTSQIVKSKDESLTGIKLKYKENLPTNISPIKNFGKNNDEDNFLNYGTNNSKNLYLLLLEDL